VLARVVELGGPLMWPLLVCSILLLAVVLERIWTVGVRGLLLRNAPLEALRAHERVLRFFVEVPPALGLLGTVLGVIECFSLLDAGPGSSGIGAGLGIACITTVAGLSIALVATVASFMLDLAVSGLAPPAAPGQGGAL